MGFIEIHKKSKEKNLVFIQHPRISPPKKFIFRNLLGSYMKSIPLNEKMMVAEHKVHIYNPNPKSQKENSLNSRQMKFSRKILLQKGKQEISVCDRDFFPSETEENFFIFHSTPSKTLR
jgi:hypothetical protein